MPLLQLNLPCLQTCMIPTYLLFPNITHNEHYKMKHLALKCYYCTSTPPCSLWPHAQPCVSRLYPLPTSIVMNQIPPTSQLQQIPQFDDPPALTSAPHTPIIATQPCCSVLLRWQIPPIPPKLHKKITEGHYVDMAELSPEYLEALNAAKEDHSKSSRPKLKDIFSILDWIQAFSIYVAVLSKDQPHRIPSLLAYQHLLIHNHTNFKQFNWMLYDHQFGQKVSTCPELDWSTMDGTLWNLCQPLSQTFYRSQLSSYSSMPICLEWNDNPAGCSCHNCHYAHICYMCVNLPSGVNRCHKAVSCPNKGKDPQPTLYKAGYPTKHFNTGLSRL